jgi:hypothetical protein
MPSLALELNITRWLRSRVDWPGDLTDAEQLYVLTAVEFMCGRGGDDLPPCPRACRPYLRAIVHEVLVPLALPVLLELELSCAEDQDP